MSIKDLKKTEEEMRYDKGFENGITLGVRQLVFLTETTIGKMRYKKNKKEYELLFNR